MSEINLAEAFFQHKNKVVNIAIIILALLLSHNFYQQQIKIKDSLEQKEANEVRKNAVLEDIQQLELKIQNYKNFVNRKDISVAMNLMSEIAQSFSLNVISIRPQMRQAKPLYVRHFFDLKLEANHYHDLGKFISKLESSRELYSVENLKISPMWDILDQTRKYLTVDLTVSTILLKE